MSTLPAPVCAQLSSPHQLPSLPPTHTHTHTPHSHLPTHTLRHTGACSHTHRITPSRSFTRFTRAASLTDAHAHSHTHTLAQPSVEGLLSTGKFDLCSVLVPNLTSYCKQLVTLSWWLRGGVPQMRGPERASHGCLGISRSRHCTLPPLSRSPHHPRHFLLHGCSWLVA